MKQYYNIVLIKFIQLFNFHTAIKVLSPPDVYPER